MVQHLQAVIFDMDGVIAETEGDGHRVAFNQAFRQLGLDAEWDYAAYGELLKISGGKERMKHYFASRGTPLSDNQIAELHQLKTSLFQDLITGGGIPPRPGIPSFVQSLLDAGVKVGLATTSNEKAANTLLCTLLGRQVHGRFDCILAGDIVAKKKPDPAIYNLAKERMQISPERSFVIEDTRNGLLAAQGAGFHVCITKSAYSGGEDFTGAAFVVNSIAEGNISVDTLDRYLQEHSL